MYKILFLILSLFVVHNSYAEILGFALLKNKQENRKVVILYDQHDELPTSQNVKQQQVELQTLIDVLSTLKVESSFFIEFPYRSINFKKTFDFSTVHVPIKIALKHNMQLGSIKFISFDQRADMYFWLRELMTNMPAVQNAIKIGHTFPQEYTNSTWQMLLTDLQDNEKEAKDLLQKMPEVIQKEMAEKIKLFDKAQTFITEQLLKYKVDKKEHLIKLIQHVSKSPEFQKRYADTLIAADSVYSDLFLINSVLNDTRSVTVVLAGLYHAQQLENALRAAGFTDAFPDIDFKHGLDASDLTNIK